MEKGINLKKIKTFFSLHWQIVVIMVLAAFLRFFRLDALTTFLGEQGRDLIIASDVLKGKLTLLGPPTSISNVHFGPFYHYFNAFFLFIFGGDPIGPAIGFSLLSILSVYFIYLIAFELEHKKAGLIAALLFAVSPWMVEYGRNTFNSFFITAFSVFSLSAVVGFLKGKKPEMLYLFLSGVFASLALQANFLAAGIPIALILFLSFKKVSLKKQIWALLGIFLAILPYLVFELRHRFFNTQAFFALSQEGGAVSFSFAKFVQKILLNYLQVVHYSISFNQPNWLSVFIGALLLLGAAAILVKNPKSEFLKLNLFFLLTGLIVVSFYPGQMLVHYLGALYPNVFLLTGIVIEKTISRKFGLLGVILLVGLVILNLGKVEFNQKNMPKGWDLDGVRKAALVIKDDAGDNFNIANLLDGDTRAYSYRYFVLAAGRIPREVEQYPQSGILYVIARDSQDILNYPVWEISSFLPAEITGSWPIKNNISVYKLEKR